MNLSHLYLPPYPTRELDECPLTGATRPPVIDPHEEFEQRIEENKRRYRETVHWIAGAGAQAAARYPVFGPRYLAIVTWLFAFYDQAAAQYNAGYDLACLCEQLREEEQKSWDDVTPLLSRNGHTVRATPRGCPSTESVPF